MNEHDLFLEALEIADPGQRDAYLDQASAGNPALRKQVQALLVAHQRSGEFLDVPALEQLEHGKRTENVGAETSAELSERQEKSDLNFLQPSTLPGSLGRLGHYEIQEVIGQGGFGTVLKALDEKLQRIVAIKVMAPELAATSPARKRFLREARATAQIRHENVVSIYAVEEEPLPYLVMEFIGGETLQQRLNRTGPLAVRDVLRIGQQIASGLTAAHDKGLIHRDIKPGNILLEDDANRVKITDFGLARSADDASVTQSGAIVGTPLYMSPEQALGREIDLRSDLFSLGSVLYVMCSGRPPFRAATTIAVLVRVVEEQPRPIQEIIPEVPDWLVAITARLHAKNPAARFASALQVGQLLGLCLIEIERGAAVEALPQICELLDQQATANVDAPVVEVAGLPDAQTPASPAAIRTASRPRHRGWLAAAATLLFAVLGLGLTEVSGVTNVRGTIVRLFSPDGTLVVEVDDPSVSVSIDGEDMVITGAGIKEIRLKPGQHKVLARKDGKVVSQELVTVTRNGRQVVRVSREAEPGTAAVAGDIDTVPVDPPAVDPPRDREFVPLFNGKNFDGWNLKNPGTIKWTITPLAVRGANSGYRAGQGGTIFTERSDYRDFHFRCEVLAGQRGETWIFFRHNSTGEHGARRGYGVPNPNAEKLAAPDAWGIGSLYEDVFQVGNQRVAAAAVPGPKIQPGDWYKLEIIARGEMIRVVVNGTTTAEFQAVDPPARQGSFGIGCPILSSLAVRNVEVLEFKPDQGSASRPTGDASDPPRHKTPTLPAPSAALKALRRDQISPAALAFAGNGDAKKAPASLVAVLGTPESIHSHPITCMAFSGDGRWLVSAASDQTILLREAATCKVARVLLGHKDYISCLAFTPDNQTLVTADASGIVKLWTVNKPDEPTTVRFNMKKMRAAVSRDGRFLAAGGADGKVRLWKWNQWDKPVELPGVSKGELSAITFNTDGEKLACGWLNRSSGSPIALYNTADGTLDQELPGHKVIVRSLAFSSDGKHLAAMGDSKTRLWDVAGEKAVEIGTDVLGTEAESACFHPDNKQLVIGYGGRFQVYAVPSLAKQQGTEGKACWAAVKSVAYSPDGKTLVVGDQGGSTRFYDTSTWQLKEAYWKPGHRCAVEALAVSPDGRTVLSRGTDNTLRRWNLDQPGEHRIALEYNPMQRDLAYSPDGKTYATGEALPLFVFDAVTNKQRLTAPISVYSLAYSPDGKLIAGNGIGDDMVHLVDVRLGKVVHRFPSLKQQAFSLAFSGDGRLLATAGTQGKVVVWNVATGAEIAIWETTRPGGIAFHPDGSYLAIGHADGTIAFWDTTTWKKTRSFYAHLHGVQSLRFTPDGRTLLSSGVDGMIQVRYPSQDRARVVIPVGPAGLPVLFGLDASGQYLFASGPTPVIYVHRLPTVGDDTIEPAIPPTPTAAPPSG